MQNKDKIIIDLCGGTLSWSKPYKDAGYTVVPVTLPDRDVFDYVPEAHAAYGILAAPPCTMFSIARQRAKTPRDFEKGMEVVIRCLDIIWQARYQNKLKFWALENPRGYLRQFLGKPAYTFKQCQYGELLRKTTDIWGYFNEPKPTTSCETVDHEKLDKAWQKPAGEFDRQTLRAVTPPGFALAFFKANQ